MGKGCGVMRCDPDGTGKVPGFVGKTTNLGRVSPRDTEDTEKTIFGELKLCVLGVSV
jgi:hypothetical protein